MLKRGTLEGPIINVYGTSKNFSELEDFSPQQKKDARKQGIFFIKIFDKIPLNPNNSNYLKIVSVNLDFKPINFNSNNLNASVTVGDRSISESNIVEKNCDNLDDFIISCGLSDYITHIFSDVTINVPNGSSLTLSEDLKNFLKLKNDTIEGPKSILIKKLDLYQKCRPCLLTMPILSKSFVVDNMDSLAMVLNTDKIKGQGNENQNFTFENCQVDSWVKIDRSDLLPYIMVQIKDSQGFNLAFEQDTDICIHFIIKTTPFDIL